MIKLNIVEDIKEIRETIQRYLQEVDDMQCEKVFVDAEEALGGLLLYRPDIVLMDIGLPGMSGIECMMKVKRQHPQMKFLMFTVFEDDENVFESLKAGADGYILKREPIQKIVTAIREVVEGGAPMSKSIAAKVLKSFREADELEMPVENLSKRQEEILVKLSKGLPYKLIADQLSVTIGTVKQHIHQIYKKLEVNNKTEAVNRYLKR